MLTGKVALITGADSGTRGASIAYAREAADIGRTCGCIRKTESVTAFIGIQSMLSLLEKLRNEATALIRY